MKHLTLTLILAALLAGCATDSGQTQAGAKVEDRTQAAKPATEKPAADTRPLVPQVTEIDPLDDPKSILSQRSIFYDLDSFEVKPEYKTLVEAHGNYLATHPKAKVFLQGNADERGSREYNLALGQKRADGVRKILSLMGAKDEQMEAVSFGEEKPRAECHDESCWSQNRRTDFVYQGK